MKKLISILFAMLFTSVIFAQNVKSAGVTDSDVKNYAKNFNAISKAIEKVKDNEATAIDSILEKNGISGPNRFEKFTMITNCAMVAVYDYSMESDPESAELLKKMGMDPVADIRKLINQKDYDVVYPNAKLLEKALN